MATASYREDTGFSIAGLRVPSWFSYTACLFVVTRIVLTAIGILGYGIIAHKDIANYPGFLKIWDVWDSDS